MRFVITGAGRGIGRGLARHLLQRGHAVYLIDSNEHELNATLARCKEWASSSSVTSPSASSSTTTEPALSARPRFKGRLVDLSNRAALSPLVVDVGMFFGGAVDVLVNNAMATPHVWPDGRRMEDGGGRDADVERDWDLKVAVGLTAPFLLARRLAGMLRAGRTGGWGAEAAAGDGDRSPGCIVNISSTRATMAEPDHEAYSAVKAGLIGLTQSMAVSLGQRHRIRVNAILPGWINVENENDAADKKAREEGRDVASLWRDGLTEQDHKWHPAGRVGRVEDIASTVLYLAENAFVTGEQITVDGGVTRKMVYPE